MIPDRMQYFLKQFETTNNVTKSGPSNPISITKILQKIQEEYGNILERILLISENLKFGTCVKVHAPNFCFLFFWICMRCRKVEVFENWKQQLWFGQFGNGNTNNEHVQNEALRILTIWTFRNSIFGNWTFSNWKYEHL